MVNQVCLTLPIARAVIHSHASSVNSCQASAIWVVLRSQLALKPCEGLVGAASAALAISPSVLANQPVSCQRMHGHSS